MRQHHHEGAGSAGKREVDMEKLKNILLIDDDDISSWLNKTILEKMDISEEITCIYDGSSALAYLQKVCSERGDIAPDCPELILLDLNMPKLDGFELLDKLGEQEKGEWLIRERIVILTTSISKIDFNKASNYQLKGYLVKPLSEKKIREILKDLPKSRQHKKPASDAAKAQDRAPSDKPGADSPGSAEVRPPKKP